MTVTNVTPMYRKLSDPQLEVDAEIRHIRDLVFLRAVLAERGATRGELLQYVPGIVDRTVIDDNDFVPLRDRRECRAGLFHKERKVLRLVFCWYEDAYVGPARYRLKRWAAVEALRRVSLWGRGHTRLRIRAERTPS